MIHYSLHLDLILSAFDGLVLGHNDIRTTMIYTHVLNTGGKALTSPADNFSGKFDAYYTVTT